MFKNFINKDMDIIAEVLSSHTNTRLLFNKSFSKFTKVNTLAKFFSDKLVWYPRTGIQNQCNVKLLKDLCSDCINITYYPKTILACCIYRI